MPWLSDYFRLRDRLINASVALTVLLLVLGGVAVLLLQGCGGSGRPPLYERWNVTPCALEGCRAAAEPLGAAGAGSAESDAGELDSGPQGLPDASVPDTSMPTPQDVDGGDSGPPADAQEYDPADWHPQCQPCDLDGQCEGAAVCTNPTGRMAMCAMVCEEVADCAPYHQCVTRGLLGASECWPDHTNWFAACPLWLEGRGL